MKCTSSTASLVADGNVLIHTTPLVLLHTSPAPLYQVTRPNFSWLVLAHILSAPLSVFVLLIFFSEFVPVLPHFFTAVVEVLIYSGVCFLVLLIHLEL